MDDIDIEEQHQRMSFIMQVFHIYVLHFVTCAFHMIMVRLHNYLQTKVRKKLMSLSSLAKVLGSLRYSLSRCFLVTLNVALMSPTCINRVFTCISICFC